MAQVSVQNLHKSFGAAAVIHGVDIDIVDGELLRIDNTTAAEVVEAVLSVMPLDAFVDDSAARMAVVGAPGDVPAVPQEVQTAIDAAEGKPWPMISVERFAFYQRAKQAYCVIQTGERRFYGCFAFRKGVVPPAPSRAKNDG